jgi:uncharacterized protein YbaR (Trm112 family)
MRRDTVDVLACPLCKGDLKLDTEKEEGDEVISGWLECKSCRALFLIEDGIPNLLADQGGDKEKDNA